MAKVSGKPKRSPRVRPTKQPARKARSAKKPARAAASSQPKVLPVEVEPSSIEKTLAKLREELGHWVSKGRYTKVRFKLRGKPILPDLPIGAVIAAEAVTFWWAGLLRALLVSVGANAVLDVELIHETDREVARGREALLAGDLDKAVESFRKALRMDHAHAGATLNLGIVHKLRGEAVKARECLEKAEQLDPQGMTGDEARRLLDQLNQSAPPNGGAPLA